MEYRLTLPRNLEDCPEWWQNIVRERGVFGVRAVLLKHDAYAVGVFEPSPETMVIFTSEQAYTLFLLRWS